MEIKEKSYDFLLTDAIDQKIYIIQNKQVLLLMAWQQGLGKL